MKVLGLIIILAGWAIAVGGLFVTSSTSARGLIALIGIAVTLFGIFGVLNQAFLKTANWKQ